MSELNRYEPENINGIVIMVGNDSGRYVLKTDYDLADKKTDTLINVIFLLQKDIFKLESKEIK